MERLTKGIEIKTAGGTNLYSMVFRDSDAEKAKRVIQAMVSIFVESGLGASRKDTDSAKMFLNEQIKVFESKLEEAESRLKEFRLRNLGTQSPDGKDAASRVGEVAKQLEQARLELAEAENARDSAKKQIADEKLSGSIAATTSLMQEPGTLVATPEIDARIEAQKRNIDQLLQRYTEAHPDIMFSRKMLREMEDQRKKEVADLRKAAVGVRPAGFNQSGTYNLAMQEISRILATSEVQVAALRARVSEYASRYAVARESLKTAPQLEAEAAQLNRDYAITKKGYEDLVSRRQAAVMSGDLDVASGVAEFRLIDPPRVAPKPVSPNRMILLPGVLVASLGLGLFFAFVASQLRPTFSSAEDLRQQTGLPLLGVVTLLTSDADRQGERTGLFRFVAASGGLVALFAAGLISLSLMSRFGG